MAPCGAAPDPARYAAALHEVKRLFSGKPAGRMRELQREMDQAAQILAFERAAACKMLLEDLRRLQRRSRNRFHLPGKGTALVFIRSHRERAFSVFYVLDGRVLRRADFPQQPSGDDILAFARSPHTAGVALEEGEWLARCLAEVGARKQFVLLPEGKGEERVVEKAFRQFLK